MILSLSLFFSTFKKVIIFFFFLLGACCWLSKCVENSYFCIYCIVWDQSSGKCIVHVCKFIVSFCWMHFLFLLLSHYAGGRWHSYVNTGNSLQNLSGRGLDMAIILQHLWLWSIDSVIVILLLLSLVYYHSFVPFNFAGVTLYPVLGPRKFYWWSYPVSSLQLREWISFQDCGACSPFIIPLWRNLACWMCVSILI